MTKKQTEKQASKVSIIKINTRDIKFRRCMRISECSREHRRNLIDLWNFRKLKNITEFSDCSHPFKSKCTFCLFFPSHTRVFFLFLSYLVSTGVIDFHRCYRWYVDTSYCLLRSAAFHADDALPRYWRQTMSYVRVSLFRLYRPFRSRSFNRPVS